MAGRKARVGWLVSAGVVGLLALGLALGHGRRPASSVLLLEVSPEVLPADGFSAARILLSASGSQPLLPAEAVVEIVEGARRARVEPLAPGAAGLEAVLRVGVHPGPVVVEARAPGYSPARARLEAVLDPRDTAADGTPDFLRLEEEADRESFRRWFTFLAEAQFYRPPEERPAEINDCAALIRFAYREALREHDGAWASELDLPVLPGAGSVRKYRYPWTPVGAGLFRVTPGRFRPEDARNGAFAQFADARTLQRLNTHRVSRDLGRARPGDLLFFRQLEQELPFHAMVFLGPSQLEPGPEKWVLYHTGPSHGERGEIRRLDVEELLAHPAPRWRPVAGNPNFLGVYRWNILRGAD